MDVPELRRLALFDGLDDAQLGALLEASTEQVTRRGELLFHEGRPADSWWVLLDGTVALVRQVGTEESVLGYMTEPGQWAGGFAAWDEFGVYLATGRAENPGRVLRLVGARAAPAVRAVVPLRAALHRGPGQHRAPDRVHRAPARGAGGPRHALRRPRARAQQPGIRRDPRGRRPGGHLPARPVVAGTARVARHHRRAVHGAGRAAPPDQRPRARPRRPGTGRPRGRALGLARRAPGRPRLGRRAGARRRPASTSPGARSSPRRSRRSPSPRRPSGSRRRCRPRPSCRRSRRPPAGSRPWSRPCGPTRRWTAPRCRTPTSSRASTAPC